MEEVDNTGDHPIPKDGSSPWIYFNVAFNKKWVADGKDRAEGFTASGAAWGKMSDEDKKPYVEQSDAAKEVSQSRIAELKKKGYYTMEDGSKSTDEKNVDDVAAQCKKPKKPKKERLDMREIACQTIPVEIGSNIDPNKKEPASEYNKKMGLSKPRAPRKKKTGPIAAATDNGDNELDVEDDDE